MIDADLALRAEERGHLERCVELAEHGLAAGDEPLGSVLVAADGSRLAEGRNRVVATGDRTQHPEIELARWAAQHLSPAERAAATVFTSGEHCPDVRGRARLGRAGKDRVRALVGAARAVAR